MVDLYPFLYSGTASVFAEICTFPIDTTKTRLQIQGEFHNNSIKQFKGGQYSGMFNAFKIIITQEGVRALYRGLSAALIRQASYGTMKFGLYDKLKKAFGKRYRDESISSNVACAVTAGVISSTIANPTDVIKIRLQSKSNYYAQNSSFLKEFSETVSKEGFGGLYKAVIPTATRSALLVGVLLPTYDFSKHTLINKNILLDDVSCHFASSLIASIFGACVSCPVEVIRIRMMNQKAFIVKSSLVSDAIQCNYKSAIDCMTQTVKNETLLALWKGLIPTWYRIGPWNIIFFLTYEQIKNIHL